MLGRQLLFTIALRVGELTNVTGYGVFWRWTIAVSASLVFCFASLCGRTEQPSPAQKNEQQAAGPLRAAQSALKQGDPDDAIRILSEYLQTHQQDSSARVALGQAYAMAGQTNRAEEEFQTVLKAAPENYVALAALGEIYNRGGQPKLAEALLGRAVKASHGLPQIRIEWAVILAHLHEYKKAQSALSGVLPPTDREEQIRFLRLKASVALGLGDAKAASFEMEKALSLKPDDAGLMMATAAAELQAHNSKRAAELTKPAFANKRDSAAGMLLLEAQIEANEDFRPTLESLRASAMNTPDELAVRQHLAQLLVSHGKYAESVEDFQRAADIGPNRGDLLFNLALAQFNAGRLDDALRSAEKGKDLGDTTDLEDLLGDIQEARGENLAAVKSYQAAVALAPNEEKYRLSLALEFIRHKSFDAAKVVLQQAEELHPDSWRVKFSLGMLEYFEGRDEKASPILLQAANLSPEPAVALKYVGDIQMDRAAEPDPNVISQLCRYADLHPKEAAMQYYCGALLFRRDYTAEDKTNVPDILRRLNTALKELPNDAPAHCQLGRLYRWLEKWPEAVRESESCVRLAPDSAQGHYRLAQIYQHEGHTARAKEEMNLYEAASKRVADENARRDETIKAFLFTIQKETPSR
ncbi:MAG: tetratricopeptide repeat protein [Candidatus Acidiferrum sp.]